MGDNAEQIEEWNGPLGDKWASDQADLDALIAPFGLATLKAAAPKPGEKVVDVGCGCGTTSFFLVDAVGASGSVLGVDISRPMLAVGKRRAEGSANINFQEGDASKAALPQNIDLLFSRFGVMFFDDPQAAFAHLHSALKPSGRIAFCCWRTPKENPWAAVPIAAVREALDITEPPPPPTAPGPFAFADADRLRGLLAAAGFRQIGIEAFDAPVHLGGDPQAAARDAARLGPASRLIRLAGGEAVLPKALAAMEQALAPLAGSNGAVALTGAVWIVTARAS